MQWINLVDNCINNCWFSVLVNGSAAGFFHSTRGLRQGDPLSPSLFVFATDYLSRILDRELTMDLQMQYKTRLNGFLITHLAYADDVIVFSQANKSAIVQLTRCLEHYEKKLQVRGLIGIKVVSSYALNSRPTGRLESRRLADSNKATYRSPILAYQSFVGTSELNSTKV